MEKQFKFEVGDRFRELASGTEYFVFLVNPNTIRCVDVRTSEQRIFSMAIPMIGGSFKRLPIIRPTKFSVGDKLTCPIPSLGVAEMLVKVTAANDTKVIIELEDGSERTTSADWFIAALTSYTPADGIPLPVRTAVEANPITRFRLFLKHSFAGALMDSPYVIDALGALNNILKNLCRENAPQDWVWVYNLKDLPIQLAYSSMEEGVKAIVQAELSGPGFRNQLMAFFLNDAEALTRAIMYSPAVVAVPRDLPRHELLFEQMFEE